MKDTVSFNTQITEQDLYRYNIHHAYTSSQGIFSIIIAGLLLGAWIFGFKNMSLTYRVVYPVIVFLFLTYIPMNLKLKSKQQMLQPVFKAPLGYELTETGIKISSPVTDEVAELPWEYVYKIVTWKEYLLIYSNRVNAYIIPKEQIANEYEDVIAFVKEKVEDYKLTIKK